MYALTPVSGKSCLLIYITQMKVVEFRYIHTLFKVDFIYVKVDSMPCSFILCDIKN